MQLLHSLPRDGILSNAFCRCAAPQDFIPFGSSAPDPAAAAAAADTPAADATAEADQPPTSTAQEKTAAAGRAFGYQPPWMGHLGIGWSPTLKCVARPHSRCVLGRTPPPTKPRLLLPLEGSSRGSCTLPPPQNTKEATHRLAACAAGCTTRL